MKFNENKQKKWIFSRNFEHLALERCESHSPGSFTPGRNGPGFCTSMSLEMKLSITSLYIISDAPKYDIILNENSDVIDSFNSEKLKYESSVIVYSTEKRWAVLFTPFHSHTS